MQKYLVATGIRVFVIEADSPREAITVLKRRIWSRRFEHYNPEIGMSLVRAHDAGTLNYIVMDEKRTQLLCGEFEGRFEQPVSRELADSLRISIPDALYFTTRSRDEAA